VICNRCRERIPDDADVIEDLDGANVCERCYKSERGYEHALMTFDEDEIE
jgi:formylmethanofuran dehydrogenase subunit E